MPQLSLVNYYLSMALSFLCAYDILIMLLNNSKSEWYLLRLNAKHVSENCSWSKKNSVNQTKTNFNTENQSINKKFIVQ